MKKVLTIAGSDSGGGAGIQADLKTFLSHGVYGMCVITAVTAQNTMGISAIENMSAEIVGKQLDAIFLDLYPDAVKIGMVSSKNLIELIGERLTYYKAKNIVLDPVMISTSGHFLIDPEAKLGLKEKLMPLADIITPNIPEAEDLSGTRIENKDDMVKAAEQISDCTEAAILVKGGHLGDTADDLLYRKGSGRWFLQDKIDSKNTHGTGCTLSTAIAANLARGMESEQAVLRAKDYLTGALRNEIIIGKGNGPLNHGWNL